MNRYYHLFFKITVYFFSPPTSLCATSDGHTVPPSARTGFLSCTPQITHHFRLWHACTSSMAIPWQLRQHVPQDHVVYAFCVIKYRCRWTPEWETSLSEFIPSLNILLNIKLNVPSSWQGMVMLSSLLSFAWCLFVLVYIFEGFHPSSTLLTKDHTHHLIFSCG